MKNRLPAYPGRVTMTPVPGQTDTYDMARADQPTEDGTPLNKATLLQDSTAALYGLGADAVPDAVLAKLAHSIVQKPGKHNDMQHGWRSQFIEAFDSTNGNLRAIEYAQSKFVAVYPQEKYIYTSTDAKTWTHGSDVLPIQTRWIGLKYGNGVFVLFPEYTNYGCYYSSDLITWTNAAFPSSVSGMNLDGVYFYNGKFICTISSASTPYIIWSSDGVNWNISTTPTAYNSGAITYGNGTYVFSQGNSGLCYYSSNLVNWNPSTFQFTNTGMYYPVFFKDRFVSVFRNPNKLGYSYDGISWSYLEVQPTVPIEISPLFVSQGYLLINKSSGGVNEISYTDNFIDWNYFKSDSIPYFMQGAENEDGSIAIFTMKNIKNDGGTQEYSSISVHEYSDYPMERASGGELTIKPSQCGIVCGAYFGNNSAKRLIDLGFRPSFVILRRSDDAPSINNTIFGGIALDGFNATNQNGDPLYIGTGSFTAIEIVDSGFNVFYESNSSSKTNMSNFYYYYIAGR